MTAYRLTPGKSQLRIFLCSASFRAAYAEPTRSTPTGLTPLYFVGLQCDPTQNVRAFRIATSGFKVFQQTASVVLRDHHILQPRIFAGSYRCLRAPMAERLGYTCTVQGYTRAAFKLRGNADVLALTTGSSRLLQLSITFDAEEAQRNSKHVLKCDTT